MVVQGGHGCVCIHTYIHACMHACMHTYTHTCTCFSLSIYLSIYLSLSLPFSHLHLYAEGLFCSSILSRTRTSLYLLRCSFFCWLLNFSYGDYVKQLPALTFMSYRPLHSICAAVFKGSFSGATPTHSSKSPGFFWAAWQSQNAKPSKRPVPFISGAHASLLPSHLVFTSTPACFPNLLKMIIPIRPGSHCTAYPPQSAAPKVALASSSRPRSMARSGHA